MVLLLTTACNSSTNTLHIKPVVDVISPPDGAQYAPGEPVSMRIGATSSNTITRIEAHIGSILVASQDNPAKSVTFSTVVQFVPAQAGDVNVVVTAIDGAGQQSDTVILTIKVGSASTSANPAPGITGASTAQPGECKPNAAFVIDVTIPDNTVVTAGSKLVKTWRLRNTGLCTWDTGYALTFIDGEKMSAPDNVAVSPTARDAAVDISVPFVAPGSTGAFTSTWRMRAPDGSLFGNRIYMLIRVP